MTAQKTTLFFILALALITACPLPLLSCGDACYLPALYCCPNGKLIQAAFCPKNVPPTTSAPLVAKSTLCGAGLTSCGRDCFDASKGQYCCLNNVLTQASLCLRSTNAPTSTTRGSFESTTRGALKPTTKGAAPSTSSTTTSSASPVPTTMNSPVLPPAPVPVPVPEINTGACSSTKCSTKQSCCAGICYDTSVYGCSSSPNGTQQFLCPAVREANPSSFWVGSIKHEGTSAFLKDNSYKVYRNVRDFGAKGDGVTDDTAAINSAITAYGRCGEGCDSTTTRVALVYFPSGQYLISNPIIQYYHTQLVGDATDLPVLVAASNFGGMAVIDSNPYSSSGNNWYTNQNNFYRQVRNFVIDTTRVAASKGTTCIHWQVAQATSLTNIVFKMATGSDSQHQGVWMENGSGGFLSDLVFYGGKFAMWVGNQQFTSRNITVYNADTAIYMNWNWGWSFVGLYVENANIGLDMSSLGDKGQQLVGSVLLVDVKMKNTKIGIRTGTGSATSTATSCSLYIENGKFEKVDSIVVGNNGEVEVAGGSGSISLPAWGQGHVYNDQKSGATYRGPLTQATRPGVLVDAKTDNYFFQKPRPQYENYALSDFVSVKSEGAVGDGVQDDTAAIQAALYKYAGCKILYFPAGAYVLSDTVTVPAGSRLVGEVWPQLMAKGKAFQDPSNPRPMLRVGRPGEVGLVELTDLLFTASGAQPGAILVEWNIQDPVSAQGSAGMWDCHFRIGGAAGTNQQMDTCPKWQTTPLPECVATFMLMHITKTASAYLENVWLWTADHDLDAFGFQMSGQVSVYNGRGLLIESTAPVWLYGTASEHNVFYQYQLNKAKNVFMSMIQTETPYYQALPSAPTPWTKSDNSLSYNDPDFSKCPADSPSCGMAWGMRYLDTSDVFLYGAGHYNFFRNYNQTCLTTEDCQDHMVEVSQSSSGLHLYGLSTKATVNMLTLVGEDLKVVTADHTNNFCATIHFSTDL